MAPRFVVKSFDRAVKHYAKLGFQVKYRDEGFMILGRDAVEIQMNEDVDQKVRGGNSICYMKVRGIETIYREVSSRVPVDPCNGRHYSLNNQPYCVKEFALYDPFGNLLFFAEPID
jgi:hypothetical protein